MQQYFESIETKTSPKSYKSSLNLKFSESDYEKTEHKSVFLDVLTKHSKKSINFTILCVHIGNVTVIILRFINQFV